MTTTKKTHRHRHHCRSVEPMGSKGSPCRWTRKSSHGCTLPVQSVVVSMVYLSYMITCTLHVPVYIHMRDYINFNMLICCQCMPQTLFRIAFPTSLAIADGRTLAYTGNCPVTSPSNKGTWHTKQRIIRNVSKGPGFDSWMAIQWASRMENPFHPFGIAGWMGNPFHLFISSVLWPLWQHLFAA